MKQFMDKDFLLTGDTAKTLYHEYAAKMPIVDYHCHINPAEIAENRRFENITQAWLGGDHYKWRLMRANGVDEKYITGTASDKDKFMAFAKTISKAIGNPVYHWCHLELRRYFDCKLPLNADTAEEIWQHCNRVLQQDNMSVRGMITRLNVTTIATTDDPVDTLEYHKAIRDDASFSVKVLPAWRPDQSIYIEREGFAPYLERLSEISGVKCGDMSGLYAALKVRMDYFDFMGCRASDHGINRVVYAPASGEQLDAILKKRLTGTTLTPDEINAFQYAMLLFFGKEYARLGWVMEIHFAAVRNVNSAGFKALGPDTGYDCINNADCMPGLTALLDALNSESLLPRTIIFSLNPGDNAAIASAIGCFQGDGVAGKIQHGAPWWFNDTKSGMQTQMTNLANMSLLGCFVGMLTDSRSFLSYTRHEYFRRILCDLIGGWVDAGEYPDDIKGLGRMIEDISYNNAMRFFNY
ncbi:MAG: glucuronate isomerase [Acetanaerobacterium sp.]